MDDKNKTQLQHALDAVLASAQKGGGNAAEVQEQLQRFAQLAGAEGTITIQLRQHAKQTHAITGSKCFACYMDLDGFKSRVMNDPAGLFEQYQEKRRYFLGSFFSASATMANGEIALVDDHDKLLWPYMFSDSWFFSSIDDSEESLRQILHAAAGLFMRSFEMRMPARGGIALGKLWWHPTDQIILGPAIVQAYQAAESIDCFGVVVDDNVARAAPNDATTPAFTVPIKGHPEQSRTARFARLSAHQTSLTFDVASYLAKFADMASDYEKSEHAKPRVVARYNRSIEIVRAMLNGDS